MSTFIPYYAYRFLKWRLGDRSPLSAVLKVTSRCNLKCRHCPWKNDEDEDLLKERWFEIIDEVKKRGCVLCIIEGGEPLLREDLGEIVDYAKSAGMLVSVITNGTMDFSHLNPDAFWVSVDGSKKVHDRLRGNGSFRKTIRNISKNSDRNVISLTTLSKYNHDNIENICREVSQVVSGMWFSFVYPYRGFEKLALSAEDRRKAATKIMELKKIYNIVSSENFLRSVGEEWKCRPWITLNVNSKGEMNHGCTVEQLEECKCRECDMGCYGELSQAYGLKPDAIEFLKKSLGMKTSRLLFLKH